MTPRFLGFDHPKDGSTLAVWDNGDSATAMWNGSAIIGWRANVRADHAAIFAPVPIADQPEPPTTQRTA